MKIIELIINELEDIMGVEAMSVVEHPAIESNFLALSKVAKVELKTIDAEKRLLLGAALIPNKPIYRNDDINGEYYIYFSKKTVSQASQLFLKQGNQKNATIEHERVIDGMTVVESWLKEDETHDKSVKYGIDAPIGTWFISMKVDNDEVWEQVKLGKIKGFSIEAYFADKYQTPKDQGLMEEMSIIEQIKKILTDGE